MFFVCCLLFVDFSLFVTCCSLLAALLCFVGSWLFFCVCSLVVVGRLLFIVCFELVLVVVV